MAIEVTQRLERILRDIRGLDKDYFVQSNLLPACQRIQKALQVHIDNVNRRAVFNLVNTLMELQKEYDAIHKEKEFYDSIYIPGTEDDNFPLPPQPKWRKGGAK